MDARPVNNSPVNKFLWFTYYWMPVVVIGGFVFFGSSIPGRNIPSIFPYEDILYHFGIYVILALFYIRALKNTGGRRTVLRLILLTVLFGFLYGASDELHQLWTPGRSCDIVDLFIDTAGSLTGAAAGGLYLKWLS